MDVSYAEAMAILEMADTCYSEGLLTDDGENLVKRVVSIWPEIREKAREYAIYTGYLDKDAK